MSSGQEHVSTYVLAKQQGQMRLIRLIVGFIIVVMVIGLSIYKLVQISSPSSRLRIAGQVVTPQQAYQYYADQNKYGEAKQVLLDSISSAHTTSGKVNIYYQLASLATQFKQYNDANQYAQDAKKLAPNSSAAYVALAQIATAQNNIPAAKADWKLAIKNIDTNQPGYNIIQHDYQTALDNLQ